jgi:hypothetical protein
LYPLKKKTLQIEESRQRKLLSHSKHEMTVYCIVNGFIQSENDGLGFDR